MKRRKATALVDATDLDAVLRLAAIGTYAVYTEPDIRRKFFRYDREDEKWKEKIQDTRARWQRLYEARTAAMQEHRAAEGHRLRRSAKVDLATRRREHHPGDAFFPVPFMPFGVFLSRTRYRSQIWNGKRPVRIPGSGLRSAAQASAVAHYWKNVLALWRVNPGALEEVEREFIEQLVKKE